MNQNSQQSVVLDVKDLLFVILKRISIVIISGAIFMFLLIGYKLIASYKANDIDESIKTLDVTEMLSDETDVSYAERVQNVERARDIVNNISVMNNQIENQRKYVSNCVIMQIDSENEAVTTASLIIEVDGSRTNGADLALVSSYKQYILSGEYLVDISDELNINQGYLTELISVESATPSFVANVSDKNANVGIITIKVIGPTIDFTDKIMDSVIENVNYKYAEFNESMLTHEVSFNSRQSSYIVDSITRDKQYNSTNRFETLQQQITNLDKSLDSIATKLGVSKTNLYAYFSYNDFYPSDSAVLSLSSIIKYAVVGFAFGVFVIFVIISLVYIFSKKFSSQAKFFSRFYWVNKIGVVSPEKKRSKYCQYLDKKSGVDVYSDNNIELIAANITNLSNGLNKVLFTGTADINKINKLVNTIGIKADVKKSIFADPMCLKNLSEYDGVIIVEQRDYSDCKVVAEELKLISNAPTKLLGAIIL